MYSNVTRHPSLTVLQQHLPALDERAGREGQWRMIPLFFLKKSRRACGKSLLTQEMRVFGGDEGGDNKNE